MSTHVPLFRSGIAPERPVLSLPGTIQCCRVALACRLLSESGTLDNAFQTRTLAGAHPDVPSERSQRTAYTSSRHRNNERNRAIFRQPTVPRAAAMRASARLRYSRQTQSRLLLGHVRHKRVISADGNSPPAGVYTRLSLLPTVPRGSRTLPQPALLQNGKWSICRISISSTCDPDRVYRRRFPRTECEPGCRRQT
jgi:hypothetical protein